MEANINMFRPFSPIASGERYGAFVRRGIGLDSPVQMLT